MEGGGEVAYSYLNGSLVSDSRPRMKGIGRSTGRGSTFGQGKGRVGNPQDFWDQQGGREEEHR